METDLQKIKRNWYKISFIYAEIADKFMLNPFYFKIFNVIFLYNGKCTQKQLVEFTNAPKQSINNAISYFIDKGYIALKVNPKDKRSKNIVVTSKGRELHQRTIKQVELIEENILKKFTKEEIDAQISFYDKYNELFSEEVKKL